MDRQGLPQNYTYEDPKNSYMHSPQNAHSLNQLYPDPNSLIRNHSTEEVNQAYIYPVETEEYQNLPGIRSHGDTWIHGREEGSFPGPSLTQQFLPYHNTPNIQSTSYSSNNFSRSPPPLNLSQNHARPNNNPITQSRPNQTLEYRASDNAPVIQSTSSPSNNYSSPPPLLNFATNLSQPSQKALPHLKPSQQAGPPVSYNQAAPNLTPGPIHQLQSSPIRTQGNYSQYPPHAKPPISIPQYSQISQAEIRPSQPLNHPSAPSPAPVQYPPNQNFMPQNNPGPHLYSNSLPVSVNSEPPQINISMPQAEIRPSQPLNHPSAPSPAIVQYPPNQNFIRPNNPGPPLYSNSLPISVNSEPPQINISMPPSFNPPQPSLTPSRNPSQPVESSPQVFTPPPQYNAAPLTRKNPPQPVEFSPQIYTSPPQYNAAPLTVKNPPQPAEFSPQIYTPPPQDNVAPPAIKLAPPEYLYATIPNNTPQVNLPEVKEKIEEKAPQEYNNPSDVVPEKPRSDYSTIDVISKVTVVPNSSDFEEHSIKGFVDDPNVDDRIETISKFWLPIALMKNFGIFNQDFVENIDKLLTQEKIVGWKKSRGDGNCYYRAVITRYIEIIFKYYNPQSYIEKFYQKVSTVLEFRKRMAYSVDNDEYSQSCDAILKYLQQAYYEKNANPIQTYLNLLDKLQEREFDLNLVRVARAITFHALVSEENSSRLTEFGLDPNFYGPQILSMGEEAEGLTLLLLPLELGIQVVQYNIFKQIVKEAFPIEKSNIVIQIVRRTGHYDILYSIQEMEQDQCNIHKGSFNFLNLLINKSN